MTHGGVHHRAEGGQPWCRRPSSSLTPRASVVSRKLMVWRSRDQFGKETTTMSGGGFFGGGAGFGGGLGDSGFGWGSGGFGGGHGWGRGGGGGSAHRWG